MKTYNIVLKDSAGTQQQYQIAAKDWAAAIIAAKTKGGLVPGEKSDESLIIVQCTGKLDLIA